MIQESKLIYIVHGLQWKEFEKNAPLWIGAGGKVVMCQALLQLVVFVHERGALWSKAGPVFFFLFVLYRLFLVFFFSSDTLAMPSLQSTVVTKKCFLSKPKQRECNVAEKSLNMVLQHYSSHAHIKNSDSKSTYYPCFKMHIKLLSQFEKLNIA